MSEAMKPLLDAFGEDCGHYIDEDGDHFQHKGTEWVGPCPGKVLTPATARALVEVVEAARLWMQSQMAMDEYTSSHGLEMPAPHPWELAARVGTDWLALDTALSNLPQRTETEGEGS